MITLLITVLLGCAAPLQQSIGYNFSTPDVYYVLPDTLREVSGLTWIGGAAFACIQDENGIIFIYDINKKNLTGQYSFHLDGDYEGIAAAGKSIYVLRSDGTLFEIDNFASPEFRLNTWDTGIPADDNEGLCLDKRNNRLLIGCKSKIGKGAEFRDKRVIYGFDLDTRKLSVEPVYEFDVGSIKLFARNNNVTLPVKKKKKGEDEQMLKFRISALAIHPLTGKIYLLSAADFMLFIFDRGGNIEHMELLNRKLFNKAEGLSFFDNGDLLITNEGQGKVPTLLRFIYRP